MGTIILLYTAFFMIISKIAFGDLRQELCKSSIFLSIFVYISLAIACKASMI